MTATVDTVRRLAEQHLARYRNRLERAVRGEPGYRRDELKELIETWTSIAQKGYVFSALDARERGEANDALEDELE